MSDWGSTRDGESSAGRDGEGEGGVSVLSSHPWSGYLVQQGGWQFSVEGKAGTSAEGDAGGETLLILLSIYSQRDNDINIIIIIIHLFSSVILSFTTSLQLAFPTPHSVIWPL